MACFLPLVLLLPLLATATCVRQASCPARLHFAIGVYTYQSWLPSSSGKGVTLFDLSARNVHPKRVVRNSTTGENPSYCATGHSGALYCVNENAKAELTRLSRAASTHKATGAGGATHVVVLPRDGKKREVVLVANYGGAVSAFVYDGELKLAATHNIPAKFATGKGQQSAPHPHMVLPYAGGFLVPDLGSDRIWRFSLSSAGVLTRTGGHRTRAADGPRHLARHGDNVYVVNEISNTVARIQGCSGDRMQECERAALIDGVSKTVNGDAAAAVRVSADGKYLYASVRRKDRDGAIVVFKLEDGKIGHRVGVYSSNGRHPRDFIIVENSADCDSYIAVANRDSDSIVFMKRDRATGAVGPRVRFRVQVNTPTCILPVQGLNL